MVFTAQVKALGDLYGVQGIPDILIDTLQQAFGNCAQQLTHNGPVNFTAGVAGTSQWAKAQGLWVNATGNDSYVMAKMVTDRSGNGYVVPKNGVTQTIKVYLPRCGGMGDPNVRDGDVILVSLDNNADYFCSSSYMDDAIGCGKFWYGSSSDVRGGWRIVTGSSGAFPRGGTPYATGGTSTHDHGGATGSASVSVGSASATIDPATVDLSFGSVPPMEVPVHGMYLTGSTGGYVDTSVVTLTVSGTGSTGETDVASSNITVDPHASRPTSTVSVQGRLGGFTGTTTIGDLTGTGSGNTAYATTGISIATHTPHYHTLLSPGSFTYADGSITGTNHSLNTGQESGALSHTITEPNSSQGHRHAFTGLSVSISDSTGHSHSLENGYVYIEPHFHDIPDMFHHVNDPKHKHTINFSDLSFSISPQDHFHTVPISDIVGGLGVAGGSATFPGFTPTLSGDGSHTHTMSGLTISASAHTHTISSADHTPPYFGTYFIERYE